MRNWFTRSNWPESAPVGAGGRLICFLASLAASGGVASAQSITAGAVGEPATTLRPRTVAVMPFANISGRPADDWVGIGIAETVTTDIEQLGGLTVVGREALLDVLNDRDLARELGASWIVAGAFQRLGDQLRITARIVDVETGAARESVKVDGRVDEMFTLQDQVVTQLGDGLASLAGREVPSSTARLTGAGVQAGIGEGEGPVELAGAAPLPGPDQVRRSGRPSAGAGALGAAPPVRSSGGGPSTPIQRGGSEEGGNANGPSSAVTGGITIGDRSPVLAVVPAAGNAGALAGRATVRPRRTDTPPTVDGLLDDAVWQDAPRISEFVQREPVDGAPASEDTDVYLAYDDTHL